jgi:hypothetical protein
MTGKQLENGTVRCFFLSDLILAGGEQGNIRFTGARHRRHSREWR